MYSTVLILIIVFLIVWHILKSDKYQEMFSDIRYDAYKKEKQQMFEEYAAYDYKNYDFDKITDKYGNLIKKSVDNELYSTFVENNVDYYPLEYNLATPMKTIALLNDNVDLPTHTLNQKKLDEEIKQNRGKCDDDTITKIPNFSGLDSAYQQNIFPIQYSTSETNTPNFDNLLRVGA